MVPPDREEHFAPEEPPACDLEPCCVCREIICSMGHMGMTRVDRDVRFILYI